MRLGIYNVKRDKIQILLNDTTLLIPIQLSLPNG